MPRPYFKLPLDGESTTQADRVILRFGGVKALQQALALIGDTKVLSGIGHWRRRGGLVPAHNWPTILQAADAAGVTLTDEDMSPRVAEGI